MKALATTVYLFLVAMVLAQPSAQGQTSIKEQPVLPTVFLLGEFENQYEELVPGYQSLLESCQNDMNSAFEKLIGMMREMEAYASLTGYDLKGINAWMHFFWRADGTIEHIGFYLKPNSKNVNTDGLKSFLLAFAKQYKFPLRSEKKYNHYSSFSFPIAVQTAPNIDKSTAKKNGNGRN